MKINLIGFALLFSVSALAQSNEKIIRYFDKNWNDITNRDDAAFYRTVEEYATNVMVRDYYISGKIQMIAECSNAQPKMVREGNVKYFYENGTLKEEGLYTTDKAIGLHKSYYENGNPKSEIIYDDNDKKTFRHYWTKNGDDLLQNGDAIILQSTAKGFNNFMEIEKFTQTASFQVEIATQDTVYSMCDTPSEYPGGSTMMMKKIVENIRYPSYARRNGVQGTTYVQFIVAKDGSVKDVKVLKGIDPDCDEEAIRVVTLFPSWKPGKHKNKIVQTRFVLPIKFKLGH
jgi:TonB family protein